MRLVVPGPLGYVSATKWVTDIELTRWEDFDGYWVPRGWAKEGPVKTMARIDRPRRKTVVQRQHRRRDRHRRFGVGGAPRPLQGRGVDRRRRVAECELAGVPGDDTWRQWRYRWRGAPVGRSQRARSRLRRRRRTPAGSNRRLSPPMAPRGTTGCVQVSGVSLCQLSGVGRLCLKRLISSSKLLVKASTPSRSSRADSSMSTPTSASAAHTCSASSMSASTVRRRAVV